MTLNEKISILEAMCPGCRFFVKDNVIHITEYGRGFVVYEEGARRASYEEMKGEWPDCWFDFEISNRKGEPIPTLEPDEKYQVICPIHGHVIIGYGNYHDQMRKPDMGWYCPICGETALFDDESYESHREGEN